MNLFFRIVSITRGLASIGERLLVERLLVERLLVERLLVERLLVERLLVERLLVERLLVERLSVERLSVERHDHVFDVPVRPQAVDGHLRDRYGRSVASHRRRLLPVISAGWSSSMSSSSVGATSHSEPSSRTDRPPSSPAGVRYTNGTGLYV